MLFGSSDIPDLYYQSIFARPHRLKTRGISLLSLVPSDAKRMMSLSGIGEEDIFGGLIPVLLFQLVTIGKSLKVCGFSFFIL